MKTLKLYIPYQDLDKQVKERIGEAICSDDCTFIPIRASINELDFSVEITVVATSDNGIRLTNGGSRYKMTLDEKE